jgi:hypothetical protein
MKTTGWWVILGLAAAAGVAAAYLFEMGAAADWWLVVFGLAGFALLVQGALAAQDARAAGAVLQGAGCAALVIGLLIDADSMIAPAAYAFGLGGIGLFIAGVFRQRTVQ